MLSNARPRTLLDLIHSDLSLRCLSRRERVALGALCLCVLALLAALQHGRVFLGDEIGTLRCLKRSPSYILTHFDTWLSMNYFILVEKGVAWLSGAADWRLTLLPMAAAIAINSGMDGSSRSDDRAAKRQLSARVSHGNSEAPAL